MNSATGFPLLSPKQFAASECSPDDAYTFEGTAGMRFMERHCPLFFRLCVLLVKVDEENLKEAVGRRERRGDAAYVSTLIALIGILDPCGDLQKWRRGVTPHPTPQPHLEKLPPHLILSDCTDHSALPGHKAAQTAQSCWQPSTPKCTGV